MILLDLWQRGALEAYVDTWALADYSLACHFASVTCDKTRDVQHPFWSGGWFLTGECFLYPVRIAELEVSDENDINWDLLAEGWSSVRSPQWLRSKWWTIKRQIANHKDVSFPGNVLVVRFPENFFHKHQRNKAGFFCLLKALQAEEHIAF